MALLVLNPSSMPRRPDLFDRYKAERPFLLRRAFRRQERGRGGPVPYYVVRRTAAVGPGDLRLLGLDRTWRAAWIYYYVQRGSRARRSTVEHTRALLRSVNFCKPI